MSSWFALRVARHRDRGLSLCATFFLAHLFAPLPSHAQDLWGGSLAVTSDYRVRGLSKTRGDAAIQAGAHLYPIPGWVLGAWASTISRDRGRSSAVEIDAYTGYTWNVARDWDAKLGLTHYWFPNDPRPASYDYDEVSASLVFRSQLMATVAWSPNTKYFGRYRGSWQPQDGASISYELTGLRPITSALAVTAGVGYHDLQRAFAAGYWYWNAGLSYAVGPLQLDLSRIDSDATAEALFGSTVSEAGWSAAVSWRF
jgi:uncharacterized protein (TIGR02001 family)